MIEGLLNDERRDTERAFRLYSSAVCSTREQDQQPRLWAELFDDPETLLWAAFLWACSYDGAFCWVTLSTFPEPPSPDVFEKWYLSNYERVKFDADFRWKKSRFPRMYRQYKNLVGNSQETFLRSVGAFANFDAAWNALDSIDQFGRLSRWDYVEALNIFGFSDIDAPDFALKKAESVRNGVAYAAGEPDLATKKGVRKSNGARLNEIDAAWLNETAERLFEDNPGDTRLGVETLLCWFKKKACRANNSRYFGYDEDKTYGDIKFVESRWPLIETRPLYDARELLLPPYLLAEKRPENAVKEKSKTRMALFYRNGIMPEEKLHLLRSTGLNEIRIKNGSDFRDYYAGESLFRTDKNGQLLGERI